MRHAPRGVEVFSVYLLEPVATRENKTRDECRCEVKIVARLEMRVRKFEFGRLRQGLQMQLVVQGDWWSATWLG